MVELQPSKLAMGVRSPSPALLGVSQAPHGPDDLSGGRELVEDLGGAGTHGLLDVGGVEARAHDQDRPRGVGLSQFPDQVGAVAVGEAEIEDHHVEARPRGLAAGLGHGARLGDHLEVWLAFEQGRNEVPEVGVVVHQHDAGQCREAIPSHFLASLGKGARNRILVPRPGSLSISSSPPTAAARSRMLPWPTPGTVSGPNPCPSSEISAIMSSPSVLSTTVTLLACECRLTLVNASWSTRQSCVPVSPNGCAGKSGSTSRLIS